MRPIVLALLFYLLFAVQAVTNFFLISRAITENFFKKNARTLFVVSVICSFGLLLLAISLFPHRNIKARLSKRGKEGLGSKLFRRVVPILAVLMLVCSVWLASLHYRNWKDGSINYFDSSNNEGMASIFLSFILFLIPMAPFLPHVVFIR